MPAQTGYSADYSPEMLNRLIASGQWSGNDPNDPIVTVTPDGRQLTASQAQAYAAQLGTGGDMNVSGAELDQGLAGFGGQQGEDFGTQSPETDPREQRYGNDMAWLDPMFQQDASEPIQQARALGTTADPTSEAGQRDLLGAIQNRGNTSDAASEAGQRGLVGELENAGTTADTASEATQRGSIDKLLGIYDQGGLTNVERNERAKNRADTENWLKGQREADQQDLAERGVGGSGAEIATLLGDRQNAASRLSAADLQTSSDAEERALQALLSGTDVAGTMRGQADQYKQANNALRSNTLGQMRGQSDAYVGQNTDAASRLLGDMRSSADQYEQQNADRIAQIAQGNKDYLRTAQQDMLANRQNWDTNALNQGIGIAQNQQEFDAGQNKEGWDQGTALAGGAADAFNAGQANSNSQAVGAFTGQTPGVQAATQARVNTPTGVQGGFGQMDRDVGTAASAVANYYTGGAAGAAKQKK